MGSKILVLGLMFWSSAAAEETLVSVTVRGGAEVGSPAVIWARATAGEMFATAGIRVEWCYSAKGCSHWNDRIVVTLEHQAPSTLAAAAMAEAQVFEGRNIRIYLDRIDRAGDRSLRPRLLAHVMVHEITHLLQGCNRHSADGIMKARWSNGDHTAMRQETLPFAPEDIELIRLGLVRRRSSTAVVASAVK